MYTRQHMDCIFLGSLKINRLIPFSKCTTKMGKTETQSSNEDSKVSK